MRWILRHALFALCFSLGSTAWYILAQKKTTPAPLVQTTQEPTIDREPAPIASRQPETTPGHSIRFGPLEPIPGYANRPIVILRESADETAPVVARLKAGDYREIFILGGSRDFLHVQIVADEVMTDGLAEKQRVYRGWTPWGFVVPEMGAIVMDAEKGTVVSRVPLNQGLNSVIFSPDGSRAIFTGDSSGSNQTAYEVQTSDYTLTRSLVSSEKEPFSALFYGPASGEIYAKVYDSGERLVRIGDGGAANAPTTIAPNISVSPDGLLGFIVRQEEGDSQFDLTIDVMELTTMGVRNTFKLRSETLSADGSGLILNRDGSELYVRLWENTGTISVIDTRTGQLLREIPESATQSWSYFWRDSIVGDSLLLRVWDEGEEESHEAPTRYWLSNGRRTLAEKGVDYAVEAGGKRYAVNDEGTLLFRLNDKNRIQKSFRISRPERGEDAEMGNSLNVFGLSASPDGKYLIMFVGMSHGC